MIKRRAFLGGAFCAAAASNRKAQSATASPQNMATPPSEPQRPNNLITKPIGEVVSSTTVPTPASDVDSERASACKKKWIASPESSRRHKRETPRKI